MSWTPILDFMDLLTTLIFAITLGDSLSQALAKKVSRYITVIQVKLDVLLRSSLSTGTFIELASA